MILGHRIVNSSTFRGINLFLLRDWYMPIEALGAACFNAFDESLRRLRSDPNATRLHVPGQAGQNELNTLHTATVSALRSLPERYREGAEVFTLLVSRADPGTMLSNLPAWAFVTTETQSGELYLHSSAIVEAPSQARPAHSNWQSLRVESDDNFVHVSLFSPTPRVSLAENYACRFLRMSTLLEQHANYRNTPTLSLAL
jgi:hypothetical protein